MSALKGQCMCGAVTLEFEPVEQKLGACHCEMCRRWTGSAFLEIDAKLGTLTHNGPVKSYTSSEWAERAWCDTCGSTLWYHLTLPKYDYYSISAGLVDNAGGLTLQAEIYIDVKPEGYAFAGTHETKTKAEIEAGFAAFVEGTAQ
ncbi:GFA family protein [Planktotalea sp.]|uniref:GFA family protein n=1 Tax=Planktotalea sp. TaxID=2029877 RepID=UPI0025DFAEF9|nr:GFA family protein [Planktotalea sp.]